ncbi:MAG: hypothetical protein LBR66_03105 [Candidatus Symbiothrix sp.]|jgi:hypothetical protein|nr:hypothetical protein [Candidatus Symbiothrix sp.]
MKKKVLVSLSVTGIIVLVIFNLSIVFNDHGDPKHVSFRQNYEALGGVEWSESSNPEDFVNPKAKEVACPGNNGSIFHIVCELDYCVEDCYSTSCDDGTDDNPDTGNSNTDICLEQGHKLECYSGLYVYCCRCNWSMLYYP